LWVSRRDFLGRAAVLELLSGGFLALPKFFVPCENVTVKNQTIFQAY
jgi:hypothetical protein